MKGLCKDMRRVRKEQEGRGGRPSLEFGGSFDDRTSLVYVQWFDYSVPVNSLLRGEACTQVYGNYHCSLQ